MSIVLALVAGMLVGSVMVLVMGAVFAASKSEQEREMNEVHRRYVDLLERTAFGLTEEDDAK